MSDNEGANKKWHSMEIEEVLSELDASKEGLSEDEAQKRLEKYGPNKLQSKKGQSRLERFLSQFKNVLIYILLVAAVITAILGEWADTGVIIAVVLINAVIGYIQEGKAEKAMESIRGMLTPKAQVFRDGRKREISAEKLVPGDIVVVGSGDRIPADIRIIKSKNAQADEATLTGESEPVNKQTDAVEEDAAIGDRKCMGFSSTMMTDGQVKGVVAATGKYSEIGHIGEMVSGVEKTSTPLMNKIDKFGKKLSIFIVLLSAVLFAIGYFIQDSSVTEMFMVVVSLAVAAIPQGLPAIMTVTLALGVQQMAKRNAIMRKLPAVETLGSVTVIFSDKTGTLTRNEMTVAKVALADKVYTVSGKGYSPEGQFSIDDEKISPEDDENLVELGRVGMLSSDSRLKKEDDKWSIEGKPTEGAAVVLGYKVGLDRDGQEKEYPRIDEIPFESERRYMATLHKREGGNVIFVKGAPERLFEMSSNQRRQESEESFNSGFWKEKQEELAESGHRVLGIAKKKVEAESLEEEHVNDLTFLGLIGIIDPPREEAIEAVDKCHKAGINVKMVTGDHALTARSIGSSIGIGDGEHVVTGSELERLSDEEFGENVKSNDVFARSSPEHKLKMIESLQSQHQVVAMTGDGVNDSPALKKADVGVAMGIKGSEAAKEAAEIVLADDNFATIERAVEEGRTIYDNLIKTILFVLPTNGAESLMVISAVILFFTRMPISPLQILWVNMITAVTLAISLAFEPSEEGIMERPPRAPDEPILSGYLIWRIAFVAVLIAAAAIGIFQYYFRAGASLEQARTVAVNTLVAGQLFYLFNARHLISSSFNLSGIFGNKISLISVAALIFFQLIFTYWGPVQNLFGTEGLTLVQWGLVAGAGLAIYIIVELEKMIVRAIKAK